MALAHHIAEAGEAIQNDLLVLQDERGKSVVRITKDAEVIIDDEKDVNNASIAFWEAILAYLPADKKEEVRRSVLLVKGYKLLKTLVENKYIKTEILHHNQEDHNHFQTILDELDQFFIYE
jgi:hypothetical protein